VAARLCGEHADCGQSKPCRLVSGLCGEEGLKGSLGDHLVHAGAGVGNPDLDVVAGRQLAKAGRVLGAGDLRAAGPRRVDVRGLDGDLAA